MQPFLDPGTALILGTFLVLAIGAFLGVMHKHLPVSVQPAARVWRIANLLMACGMIMIVATPLAPAGFIVPFSNALLLVGIAGFVHALRLFYRRKFKGWLFVPCVVVPPVLYWFTVPAPNFPWRILIMSAATILLFGAGIVTLHRARKSTVSAASLLLMLIFGIIVLIIAVRGIVFGANIVGVGSLLDASHWANGAFAVTIVLTPIVSTVAFLLMCMERITQQWREAATTDYLTGLPNRLAFTNDAARLIATTKQGVAIAMLDVDHFKQVNDRYGHDAGDAALKSLAASLRVALRAEDVCARMGGEEFALAYRVPDSRAALELAERVRHHIERGTFTVQDESKHITASIGLAFRVVGDDKENVLEPMLKAADGALYAAKSGGRNCVVLAEG